MKVPEHVIEELMNLPIDLVAGNVLADYPTRFKRCQSDWAGPCPWHGVTRSGRSFVLNTRKNIAHCFKCERTVGPIRLVSTTVNLDFRESCGYLVTQFAPHLAFDDEVVKDVKPHSGPICRELKPVEEIDIKTRDYLRELWKQSTRIDHNPFAMRYLKLRGCEINPHRCEMSFRAHHAVWHVETRNHHPAIIAWIRANDNDVVGCEIRWIGRDGRALDVDVSRKTRKFRTGQSSERIEIYQPINGELVIAEGTITALSYWHNFADEDSGLYALMSANNFDKFQPPDGVDRIVIAADNDEKGFAKAEALRERLSIDAKIVVPSGVNDWNDLIMSRGQDEVRIHSALQIMRLA